MKLRKLFLTSMLLFSVAATTACGGSKENNNDNPQDEQKEPSGIISSIEADTADATVAYYIGDEFSTNGLKLKAYHSNGVATVIDSSEYTVDSSKFDGTKTGRYQIVITWTNNDIVRKAYYYVTVQSILTNMKHLVGLNCSGAKTEYSLGQTFSKSGLTVTATYYDPAKNEYSTKDVTDLATVDSSKYKKNKVGYYEIIATYSEDYESNGKKQTQNISTFYNVEVSGTLDEIVVTPMQKTYEAYTLGYDNTFNTPDLSDLTVKAYFIGSSTPLTLDSSEYTITIDGEPISGTNFSSNPTDAATGVYKSSYNALVSYTYKGVTKTQSINFTCTGQKTPVSVLDPRSGTYSDVYTSNYTTGIFTLNAQAGGAISVNVDTEIKYPYSNAVQYIFGKRFQLNGDGSTTGRSISMELTKGQRVVAYVMGDDSAALGVTAGFYSSTGTILQETEIDGETITKITYIAPEAGTYYLWGTGAVNVYYLAVYAN